MAYLLIYYQEELSSLAPFTGAGLTFAGGTPFTNQNRYNAFDEQAAASPATRAWSAGSAAAGAAAAFDVRSYKPEGADDMTGVELFVNATPASTATYDVQYGDSPTSGPWTMVFTGLAPAVGVWTTAAWTAVGAKRAWRLLINAVGTGDVNEVRWRRASTKVVYYSGTATVTINSGIDIRWVETSPAARTVVIPWTGLIKSVEYG